MKVDFGHESHCIVKHICASYINLTEDISKEERRLSNEKQESLEKDEIGHNFWKAFGHMVCAVGHASESEQEFLSRMADDLRAVYQLLCESLSANRGEAIELRKKVITVQGKILKKLTEHYKVEGGEEEGGT